MLRLLFSVFATSLLVSHSPLAAEPVSVNTVLSDDAFYRLVACEAKPTKRRCSQKKQFWKVGSNGAITLAIRVVQDGYPAAAENAFRQGLKKAVSEINAAGAGIQLDIVAPNKYANISIYLVNAGDDDRIKGGSLPGLSGGDISTYSMRYWYRGRKINEADMIVGKDMNARNSRSYALAQLLVALGLYGDIDGPAYERKSVFHIHRSSNMSEQDKRALRTHYPPR